MAHAYVSFRIHLARHGLLQLGASLRGSAEIAAAVFAPVLLGLLALAALPPLYAATLDLAAACALLLAHALAMAAPAWLLRQRLMPRDVAAWLRALPVPPRTRLAADALVAGLVAAPLGLLYAASLAVWLVQRPDWLAPARGAVATIASFALTVASVAAMLALRSHAGWRPTRAPRAVASYAQPRVRGATLFLWRRLYWSALWRGDGAAGPLLAILFAGALACAWTWMRSPFGLPRAALALAASAVLVLLMDRSDKARRAQAAVLAPAVAAWPVPPRALARCAQWLAAAPGLGALAALFVTGLAPGAWQHAAGRWYLGLALMAQLLLAAVPAFSARGRVATVTLAILVLTAIGGEIWQ